MALAETSLARLLNAFIETDATVQGGAPALVIQVASGASGVGEMTGLSVQDLLDLAFIQTDSTVAGGAPALRVILV